jgi:hypothetical protein
MDQRTALHQRPGIQMSRREFFAPLFTSGIMLGTIHPFSLLGSSCKNKASARQFHTSMSTESIEKFPELPIIVRDAGISDVWIGAAYFGALRRPPEGLRKQADTIERLGMKAHLITLPLGHPSDPVGTAENPAARAAPAHWKNGCTHDGQLFSGTSIHAPAISENIMVLKKLEQQGFDSVFLDDDFRLGRYPGSIGGCFCGDCRTDFLNKHGYGDREWAELIASVSERKPSKILRTWIGHICDIHHDMFVSLQQAVPGMDLGIMVMYLGSEKAGIALDRYGQVPFRVGELMFNDERFGKIKGKTDELFSVLFHRRFVKPELAYSETTVFPEAALSAENMAAKLNITLMADVRHTLFMSGINPIPLHYWPILKPAMQKSAALHEEVAGHQPAGPFKHFWGWDNRLVGEDKPFSLFLTTGVPFGVTEDMTSDGWYFLSDEDAVALAEGRLEGGGQHHIVRPGAGVSGERFTVLEEHLEDLFSFKRKMVGELKNIPYAAGDIPAVFAWYPTAGKALIWNVEETRHTYQIKRNNEILQTVTVDGLDVALLRDI